MTSVYALKLGWSRELEAKDLPPESGMINPSSGLLQPAGKVIESSSISRYNMIPAVCFLISSVSDEDDVPTLGPRSDEKRKASGRGPGPRQRMC